MANYADLTDTELSARVAEKVMGLAVIWSYQGDQDAYDGHPQLYNAGDQSPIPGYATDGSAMLEVLERMRELGHDVEIKGWGSSWDVVFWREQPDALPDYGPAHALVNRDSLPRAVAEAALAAITSTEGTET